MPLSLISAVCLWSRCRLYNSTRTVSHDLMRKKLKNKINRVNSKQLIHMLGNGEKLNAELSFWAKNSSWWKWKLWLQELRELRLWDKTLFMFYRIDSTLFHVSVCLSTCHKWDIPGAQEKNTDKNNSAYVSYDQTVSASLFRKREGDDW